MILLGIIISTSLITGINIASDSLGSKKFQNEFDKILCDFSITSNTQNIAENFTKAKYTINFLKNKYVEIADIYAANANNYFNSIFNVSSPINWTFLESQNFNNTFFHSYLLLGVDDYVLNLDICSEIIKFDGDDEFNISSNLSKREIYISKSLALKYNIEIGNNISVGQLIQEFDYLSYPLINIINYTYSADNLTVKGIFEIKNLYKFYSLYDSLSIYDSEYLVLTSPEMVHVINDELWGGIEPSSEWYNEKPMIGIIGAHNHYDFLNPQNIKAYVDRVKREIKYSDLSYNFQVNSQLDYLIDSINEIIMIYKLLIFAISIPVIILGGYLIRTNYFIILNGRRREIGLLKCRSTSNRQIFLLFISESILLGLIGGIFGILLGILSSGFILTIFPDFYGMSFLEVINNINFMNLNTILIGIGIGIALSILTSIGPIKRFTRLGITEALQKYNTNVQTESKITKIDWLLLALSLGTIIFAIWYDKSYLYSLPYQVQIYLEIFLPVLMAFMPIAPFLLTYILVKFICNYSINGFTKIISKLVALFNKKTDFFISRSIVRNRSRSARLVFIIAMGLSFLLISETLASSQKIFESDIRRIYLGLDSKIVIYSYGTDLSTYNYSPLINSIKNEDTLNVTKIIPMNESSYVNIYGLGGDGGPINPFIEDYYYSYFKIVFIDSDNYTNNIGDLKRFIIGQNPESIFNRLKTETNTTIASSFFLKRYNCQIDDVIYVEYWNASSYSTAIQPLKIIGEYSVLPGLDPSTSEYDTIYFVCQYNQSLFNSIQISNFNWLIEYKKWDQKQFLSVSELGVLNNNLTNYITNYEYTFYSWAANSWIINNDGYAFSMLNFLNIEKIYLLSLVAIGIGVIMYVSIQEKSVDFGILRARGVDKKIIFGTQISEGAVFLTLGSLISLTSFLSAYALNKSIGNIVFQDIAIPRVFSIPTLIIVLEISLAILIFLGVIYLATYIVSKRSDVKNISDLFRVS